MDRCGEGDVVIVFEDLWNKLPKKLAGFSCYSVGCFLWVFSIPQGFRMKVSIEVKCYFH